jgi:hypothetical protein
MRPPARRALLVVTVFGASLALACVSSEVRLTTRRQAPRSDGCDVAVYPTSKPPYPYEDLAEDRAGCVVSRNQCIERLRDDACLVGADTVYGFGEVKQSMETSISATLARKTGPAPTGTTAPAPLGHTATFER